MENADRQKLIVRTSVLGVIVNLIIATAKIVVGTAAASLAIVSEGLNNAADAGSSLLTLVGTKLSARHPDRKHPFGYGRIEYLTSLTVALLILYTGVTLLISSVKGIIHPEAMDVSVPAVILVAASAVIKFLLGTHIISQGRRTGSQALTAVGREGRNDSFFSLATIAVSVIYLAAGVSLDAWAGALFALVIIKSGAGTLLDTVSELIGRPGKAELARQLYREIRATPGVLNAADLMLHNYGPDSWSGSVNLEIDHSESVGGMYEYIHALQLRIMHEYRVTLVFGIYAVNNDTAALKDIRARVAEFVRAHEHVESYHALYRSPDTGRIYVDLVVGYELNDWDALRREFTAYMRSFYPENELELTIETDFIAEK